MRPQHLGVHPGKLYGGTILYTDRAVHSCSLPRLLIPSWLGETASSVGVHPLVDKALSQSSPALGIQGSAVKSCLFSRPEVDTKDIIVPKLISVGIQINILGAKRLHKRLRHKGMPLPLLFSETQGLTRHEKRAEICATLAPGLDILAFARI